LAAAYAAHNQFAEARRLFEKALSLDSHNLSALTGLGNVEFKTGRDQPAIDVLSRAIQLDARAPEPLILRGRSFTRLKRYPRALADFKTAIQMSAGDPEIFYYLSQTYRAMNRSADSHKALAEYKRLKDQVDNAAELQREAVRLKYGSAAFGGFRRPARRGGPAGAGTRHESKKRAHSVPACGHLL
jgi:tetratricopeptide (TPR) repeat protein